MAGVTVRLLGSGDAFASGGRFQTCILLESGETKVLLDCGASSLIPLKRAGVAPNGIGLILISHLHGDHFGGLPFLVLDGQFSGRTGALTVAGPPGLEERVTMAMEVLFPGSAGWPRKFRTLFRELAAAVPTTVAGVTVTPFEVKHLCGAPAYALRVALGGRVIAFSGDTEWTESLLRVTAGADLFICEASTYDTPIKYHLDYRTLLQQRHRLGCRRLVLTHLGPDLLSRAGRLELETAEDGLCIDL